MKIIGVILDYLEHWGILICFSISIVALTISIVTPILLIPSSLIAVMLPFFILMGAVMVRGQSATRLVQFAWEFVSWLPGGLGITAVISSGVFGAISGSAISTVVTIGGFMFPHMDKYRYSKDF
jgi:C4-dicarboxylate transporter DctM subunit